MRTGPSHRAVSNLGLKPYQRPVSLEPRFEALPKTGKSPNSPGGVTAKAVTPHPQRVNIIISSDSCFASNL